MGNYAGGWEGLAKLSPPPLNKIKELLAINNRIPQTKILNIENNLFRLQEMINTL